MSPEAWIADRYGTLSASNFAAAIGIAPYCSRQKLWRILTGVEPPFAGSSATEWGLAHEDVAVSAYECHAGLIARPAKPIIHPAYSWIRGTPDGYVADGMLEVKAPYSLRVHTCVPVHYMAQVQGYLEIADKPWCDFWSWTPEGGALFRVYRNEDVWSYMLPLLTEFWQHVLLKTDPGRMAGTQGIKDGFIEVAYE